MATEMKRYPFELNAHEIGFLQGLLVGLLRTKSPSVIHMLHRLDEIGPRVYDETQTTRDFAAGVGAAVEVTPLPERG